MSKKRMSSKVENINVNKTYTQVLLQELMTVKGHSIAWIAKQSQLAPSTLYSIYKGQTKQPKPAIFRKILLLYCWCFYRKD